MAWAATVGAVVCLAPARPSEAARAAAGDAPTLRASVACEPVRAPARIVCDASIRVDAGQIIEWADVQVVAAPPYVTTLKGRLAPADAVLREDDAWRFGFAFVAREAGQGEAEVRVRAVVCVRERCTPEERTVRFALVAR